MERGLVTLYLTQEIDLGYEINTLNYGLKFGSICTLDHKGEFVKTIPHPPTNTKFKSHKFLPYDLK